MSYALREKGATAAAGEPKVEQPEEEGLLHRLATGGFKLPTVEHDYYSQKWVIDWGGNKARDKQPAAVSTEIVDGPEHEQVPAAHCTT